MYSLSKRQGIYHDGGICIIIKFRNSAKSPKQLAKYRSLVVVLMTPFFIYGGDVPSDAIIRILPIIGEMSPLMSDVSVRILN